MAYCDRVDIQRVIAEQDLRELTSDGEQIDWAVVDDAILRASSIVDSYISVRYSVPITPTPKILEDKTVSIAVYLIYEKRAAGMTEVPNDVRRRYEDALAWLKEVRDGKATLIPSGTGDEGIRYKSRKRIFDEKWEGRY